VTTELPTEPDLDPAGMSTRRHVLLLSAASLLIFMGAGAQQAFLLPYLEEFTDWTDLQRALVIAMVYFSMTIFRLGNVYLLRNWPQWKCTNVGATMYSFFALAMLGLYFYPSYPLALLAAAIWGWGGAAMWMGNTMQVLALTDRAKRHGLGMGLLYGATHAGWMLGVVVLGIIFDAVQETQPWVLYVAAFGSTAIGNVLLFVLPRRPEPLPELPSWSSLVEIMSRGKSRIAAFLLFAASLAFGFVLGTFTDYVEVQHGAAWLWIAAFFYPFARFVLSFTSGLLVERIGHGSLLAMGFFGGALGMSVPLLITHPAGLALTALMLGLLNGSVPVVSTALIGDSADQKRRPLVYGAMFTWRDLGVVVAVVAGKLLGLTTDNVALVFGVFGGVFVLCGIVAIVLRATPCAFLCARTSTVSAVTSSTVVAPSVPVAGTAPSATVWPG